MPYGSPLGPRRVRAWGLTANEEELLAVLKKNPNRCLSRELLLRTVWGYQQGTRSRTVDEHILRLRRKLGDEGRLRIRTVLGCGYVWSMGSAEMIE